MPSLLKNKRAEGRRNERDGGMFRGGGKGEKKKRENLKKKKLSERKWKTNFLFYWKIKPKIYIILCILRAEGQRTLFKPGITQALIFITTAC